MLLIIYGTEWPILADVSLRNYSLTHCHTDCRCISDAISSNVSSPAVFAVTHVVSDILPMHAAMSTAQGQNNE